MERHILPCRYCGADTYDEGREPTVERNPDGTLHECHERERAQAIPIIFRGQVEDACLPLTPDEVLERLRGLYDHCSSSLTMDEEADLYSLNAAIEVLKLVLREKNQVQG